MYLLTHDRLDELLKHHSPFSISLYMPTMRSGRERRQDDIRFKNLVQQAHDRLHHIKEVTVAPEAMLQLLIDLPQHASFWESRGDGLACFCAPDYFAAYRLPLAFTEQLFVSNSFHIRPLLPLLRTNSRLFILSLSLNSARLYEATQFSVREIELPQVPRSEIEIDGDEQSLQFHSHQARPQGREGTKEAIYHGQGGSSDQIKTDALQFFQRVNKVVFPILSGQRAPLVLACVGYLASLYESTNSYRYLIKGKVPGSPQRWDENELRDHAWSLVETYFQQQQQKAWNDYQSARGDRVSQDLREILVAADQGRIKSLFLAAGEERWGQYDPTFDAVLVTLRNPQEGEELLGYAASRTLSQGGDVFVMDTLPDTVSPIAAALRH